MILLINVVFVTPPNNCLFPPSFDVNDKNENLLMEELLPYLIQLDNVRDVRSAIESTCYGKLPVLKKHKQFESFKDVIDEMEEYNMKWSQFRFNTGRLPICPLLVDNVGASISIKSSNPTSSSQKQDEIQDILIQEGPHVSSMKPTQLISLARKLGCRGGQNLKALSTKAYKNKLLNYDNLLEKQM